MSLSLILAAFEQFAKDVEKQKNGKVARKVSQLYSDYSNKNNTNAEEVVRVTDRLEIA